VSADLDAHVDTVYVPPYVDLMLLKITTCLLLLTAACGEPDGHDVGMPFVAEAIFRTEGVVTEVLEAGPYRYIQCQLTDTSRHWVATLSGQAQVGDRVKVSRIGQRQQFHSSRLQRTFQELWFGLVKPLKETP